MTYTQSVVENIRGLVKKSGIKYKVIAERANLSQQQLSDLLNDRKIITAEHVGAIATALGVTVNDLYRVNHHVDEIRDARTAGKEVVG